MQDILNTKNIQPAKINVKNIVKSNIVLICGHYGCGKTNLSINLALALAKYYPNESADKSRDIDAIHQNDDANENPTTSSINNTTAHSMTNKSISVVDLDIVNPYFRASDLSELLKKNGINVVAPTFAHTTLDTPSLSPEIQIAIEQAYAGNTTTVLDIGGDADGCVALGRYKHLIEKCTYQMFYVVNKNRLQTHSATDAKNILREIERTSGLFATNIVANTHLKDETTPQTIVEAIPFAQEVAGLTNLPLSFITSPQNIFDEVCALLATNNMQSCVAPQILPVEVYVKTPWE